MPEKIGELALLRVLDLEDNQLQKMPDSLHKCLTLRRLNVRHNKLSTLPESIGHLKKSIGIRCKK
ncbi:hypothetical protein OL548_20505 [Lysinibacillus sp. MHQ-1]|nr:hypothetical protein OL548_20505 [Lysinibacillus sp. MHQ-1]